MEDRQIVALYWQRDPNAIPATDRKYGRYCKTIANNILNSAEDAEECINDTYLNAWNAMPPHRPSVLATFLGKITRHLCFDRFRRNCAEKRGGSEIDLALEELGECVSGTETPEDAYCRKELIGEINAFLNTLPQKSRDLFLCRYWYTFSIKEIAKRFSMTENNVSVILNRTRSKLKDHLAQRGYEL